jgi:DNA-binding MarR family transcriptional regulator
MEVTKLNVYESQLNDFFVTIFNDILRLEEGSLAKGKHNILSVNEMHVIEAVYNSESEDKNTMKELSERLLITASSLTIAVKTLEQKGYLIRNRAQTDKRRVYVCTTEIAKDAYQEHRAFHEKLIGNVSEQLNEAEIAALTLALGTLHRFFEKLK